jgi:hypothetical protein
MDPQASAGMPPPPPPGFFPAGTSSAPPPPPPGFVSASTSSSSAAPANTEGLYAMTSPDGRPAPVRYSNVHTQLQNNYLFADQGTLQQYARDQAADPLSEDRVDQFLDKHPWIGAPVNALMGAGAGALKTVTGLDRTPQDHNLGGRIETEMQLAAATPTKGIAQGVGETGENVGEYFTGEELLSFLGKAAKAIPLPDKLKSMTGLAQVLQKNPMLAKVLKIGATAVKQGTIGGAQTFVKTGGDAGAAATAGLETAGTGAALEGVAAPLARKAAGVLLPKATEAARGSADYAAEARAAAEPHLNAASDAIENARGGGGAPSAGAVNGNAPGSAAAPAAASPAAASPGSASPGSAIERTEAGAQPTATRPGETRGNLGTSTGIFPRSAVIPTVTVEGTPNAVSGGEASATARGRGTELPGGTTGAPQRLGNGAAAGSGVVASARALDVNKVLNQIHDFTGAADRLAEVGNSGYDALDKVTGDKFRTLNAQVRAAQNAAFRHEEGAAELFKNKLAEMDDLMASAKLPPEVKQSLTAVWRQSYQLRDFGNLWDKNLDGVPGSTNVSSEQRGVNGKGLMRDLQRAVRTYGRPQIEQTLGPQRLDNLENIARLNTTNAQRAGFNKGLHAVAAYLPLWVGAKIGESAAGLPGEIVGGMAGAAAKPAVEKVLNAVRANPKIGQFFTHAVEFGATPKVYGPMLAEMIQKSQTDASRQQQAEQQGDQQQ